jgi:hypothetical protein
MVALFGDAVLDIKYYWTMTTDPEGIPVVISRTGWTGDPVPRPTQGHAEVLTRGKVGPKGRAGRRSQTGGLAVEQGDREP